MTKHAVMSASLFVLASIHLTTSKSPKGTWSTKNNNPKISCSSSTHTHWDTLRGSLLCCFSLPFLYHLSLHFSRLSLHLCFSYWYWSSFLHISSPPVCLRSFTLLFVSAVSAVSATASLLSYAWHTRSAPLLNAFLNSPSSSSTTCFKNISTD